MPDRSEANKYELSKECFYEISAKKIALKLISPNICNIEMTITNSMTQRTKSAPFLNAKRVAT